MPDLLNYRIVDLPDATITVNRFAVEYRAVDSETQRTTRRNREGANRLVFPNGLSALTAAQRRRVLEAAINEWIKIDLEGLG